jgi:hypothetical protein
MAETQDGHSGQSRIVRALERRVEERYQQFVFWRAMRRYLSAVAGAQEAAHSQLLHDLVRGWGNSWSAQHEFLEYSLCEARATDGPILECGSGLSTLLIGAVAQARGLRMWSLEHEPRWAERVRRYLGKYRIRSVTVCLSPVRSYGDFDWYEQPAREPSAGDFSLVICDGPPGNTRGGRYGLVPVMLDRLRGDCTILLDDGAREQERAVAARWGGLLGAEPELLGAEKPFYRLRAGGLKTPREPPPT